MGDTCVNCGKGLGILSRISFGLFEISKGITFKKQWGYWPEFCSTNCKKLFITKLDVLKQVHIDLPKRFHFGNEELEIERTCQKCRKVWNLTLTELANLQSRIRRHAFKDAAITFAVPALSGGSGQTVEILKTSLDNINKCPNCRSIQFKEKVNIIPH